MSPSIPQLTFVPKNVEFWFRSNTEEMEMFFQKLILLVAILFSLALVSCASAPPVPSVQNDSSDLEFLPGVWSGTWYAGNGDGEIEYTVGQDPSDICVDVKTSSSTYFWCYENVDSSAGDTVVLTYVLPSGITRVEEFRATGPTALQAFYSMDGRPYGRIEVEFKGS